jgi:hypothetical protein
MASYSEPGSNKIKIYLPKLNANDSDYLQYGFDRVQLDDIKYNWVWVDFIYGKKVNVKKS